MYDVVSLPYISLKECSLEMASATSASAFAVRMHLRLMQHCFFKPGPPFLGLSRQNLHWLQSVLMHPGHCPHRLCLLRPAVIDMHIHVIHILYLIVLCVPFVTVFTVCVPLNGCFEC